MGKLFAVIRREYLERVRNKWFVIVTIFGPVFFAVIMIVPAYLSVRGMRDAKVADVRVVDATGAGLGARVAQRIVEPSRAAAAAAVAPGAPTTPAAPAAAPRVVRVDTVASGDLAAAESSLVLEVQADRLTGYLILDSATIASGSARYAGRNASSVGESEVLEGAVRGALMGLRLETAGVVASAADSLTRLRVRVETERITDSGKSGSGVAGAIFGFVIAFMLYMAIILYGQAIMRGVLEEKTTRVAEVILASVKPDVLLAGKVIGVGAVGLTQFAVWIASGIFFWGERTRLIGAIAGPAAATASATPGSFAFPTIEPFTIVALLLFFLLGYTFYASLFAAVGAMVSTQEEANQAVQPVMMMLVFSIIFVQPVMTNPTGRLAEVMSVIPFSAPIIMPMRMTATPVPALTVIASLAGVALAALAAIWLSARIYRVGLLMYGKRPTMRELWRWVRQS